MTTAIIQKRVVLSPFGIREKMPLKLCFVLSEFIMVYAIIHNCLQKASVKTSFTHIKGVSFHIKNCEKLTDFGDYFQSMEYVFLKCHSM